jgi:hypothetical protein
MGVMLMLGTVAICSLLWGRVMPAWRLLPLVWRGRRHASPILRWLLLLLLLLLLLNWRAWRCRRCGRGCWCCWRCSWWRCCHRRRLLLLLRGGACGRGGCGLELAALDLDLAVVVLLRSKRVCDGLRGLFRQLDSEMKGKPVPLAPPNHHQSIQTRTRLLAFIHSAISVCWHRFRASGSAIDRSHFLSSS